MRGFVITILSVSLIVLLIAFSMSLRNSYVAAERVLVEPLPLTYAAFLLDDVGYEFNSISGVSVSFNQSNDSLGIAISDSINPYNRSAEISAYKAFLEGEVADRTASTIAANFTNITGGTMRLYLAEDYAYSNDHENGEVRFIRSGGAGATCYEVNFTVFSVRQNVTHLESSPNGTLNVTIRYTDLNGTAVEEASVFGDEPNSFMVNYPNGTRMEVAVGLVDGETGCLGLNGYGIASDFSFAAALPRLDPEKRRGYEYDAAVSYTQGIVAKRSRVGK